jgi:hypothetical protein
MQQVNMKQQIVRGFCGILLALCILLAWPSLLIHGQEPPGQALLEAAQKTSPQEATFAQEKGAQMALTSDGLSFYVLWLPDASCEHVVVALPTDDQNALQAFAAWQKLAEQEGYGLVVMQTSLSDNAPAYTAEALYQQIDAVLLTLNPWPGFAMLYEPSTNTDRTYKMVALDGASTNRHFGMVMLGQANAPENTDLFKALPDMMEEEKPLLNSQWVTYCNDDKLCAEAEKTQTWLTEQGGKIVLALKASEVNFFASKADQRQVFDAYILTVGCPIILPSDQ